jgi:hypothetical protein
MGDFNYDIKRPVERTDLVKSLPRIINQYQNGFVPGILIANNGWVLQALVAHA